MIGIKGSGLLRIGGKEIPFENRVNMNFLMAAMNLIDIQNMGGGVYESFGLMNKPCNSFQICSDVADPNMDKIYRRLAFVGINSFTPAVQKPLKVVLRAGGQFQTAGTARSAGFNVVTGEGAVGGILPYVNVPRRQARVRVSGIASLPYSDSWVYHPTLKSMYRYARGSSEIWKLPFDINTGQFGTQATLLTDQFTPTGSTSYNYVITDGVNRLFRIKDNSRNVLLIYNLETEQLSEVNLSETLSSSAGYGGMAWDEGNERIVMSYESGQFYSIDPNTGGVSRLPYPGGRSSFSALYAIKEHYMMERNAIRRPYEGTDLALCDTTGTAADYFMDYLNKMFRFPDGMGWVITGTFDSITTPGSCLLYMAKEPDMAYTMITIPPTEVDVDTPFTVDYTFEVVDNR